MLRACLPHPSSGGGTCLGCGQPHKQVLGLLVLPREGMLVCPPSQAGLGEVETRQEVTEGWQSMGRGVPKEGYPCGFDRV